MLSHNNTSCLLTILVNLELRTVSCLIFSGASDFVGDTGFEPVTSSVSGKRATTAPIAQIYYIATEVATGFEPV